jgi:hypothetical protein
MRGRLHQWWALVLRHLHERPAQTPSEPGPITDDEVAQLARDSWDLYGDLTRQSVLPCTPRARTGGLASVVTGTHVPTTSGPPVETRGSSPMGHAGADIDAPTRRL